MAFIIRIYHDARSSECQFTNSIFTQLRDVEDKQRLGRPHTSTADDNVCRADSSRQRGPIHQADRLRPRTRHCNRCYPLTENQTFRQLLSINREPDISPGIIHRPRTRHFARYIHRRRTRNFARYYPSTENHISPGISIDREPDISPGIFHRPRTRHFARYYPSTENQTFRQVLSIDREPDISLGIIQVEVHYITLCAC